MSGRAGSLVSSAAESILIERMPGKSTVGIQVPNHERETIWLRDVVECESFAQSKSKLAIALGKDINGRIVTADLAAMPHVLIAGHAAAVARVRPATAPGATPAASNPHSGQARSSTHVQSLVSGTIGMPRMYVV